MTLATLSRRTARFEDGPKGARNRGAASFDGTGRPDGRASWRRPPSIGNGLSRTENPCLMKSNGSPECAET